MNIRIPDLIDHIPNRNGFIWLLSGSGGSGKTSMLLILNFFKNKILYRYKFNQIYYYCPESSFLSVEKHPFKDLDNIYHELTSDNLNNLYNKLSARKEVNIKDDNEPEYNAVIIDDFADALKNIELQKILNKILIKARHLNTVFIFTLQSYYYFPKMLRKQITNITFF